MFPKEELSSAENWQIFLLCLSLLKIQNFLIITHYRPSRANQNMNNFVSALARKTYKTYETRKQWFLRTIWSYLKPKQYKNHIIHRSKKIRKMIGTYCYGFMSIISVRLIQSLYRMIERESIVRGVLREPSFNPES